MAKDFKIKRYGYDRQHKKKQNLKKALLTLAAVAAAGLVGWFLYEPVYNFVTGFELPQLSPAEPSSPSQTPGEENPPEEPSSSQLPEEPGSSQEGLPGTMAYLPTALLADPTGLSARLEELKAQGIQGVVFDLKSPEGIVLYQSSLEIVADNLAQGAGAYDLEAAVTAIKAAGLTPVGRLWAFRDRTSTAIMYDAAVKYMDSNINWIDNSQAAGGKPWLNPNSTQAQDYILALIGEAGAKGVPAVILEGMQFPEGYSLELATYGTQGPVDKSGILADFAAKAREAGEAAGCQVWPVVSLAATTGVYEVPYGSDPAKILEAAGCGVINVQPEQFGAGVATEQLTLSNPALDPYLTVKTGLEASEEVLEGEAELAVMVQAYTSTTLPEGSNKAYGSQEIADQVRAAEEAGIERIFYYNPSGIYVLS